MDFDDTPEEARFRTEARGFLDRHLEPRRPGEPGAPGAVEGPEELERAVA